MEIQNHRQERRYAGWHTNIMSESNEQITVFQTLALNEAKFPFLKWVHSSMNGASASSPAAAALRKRQGQKPGVSDICLPFRSRGGIYPGAYIEMKFGKNNLTVEQTLFLGFVADQGYKTAVCYSADEALDFIEEYLMIKLRGRD